MSGGYERRVIRDKRDVVGEGALHGRCGVLGRGERVVAALADLEAGARPDVGVAVRVRADRDGVGVDIAGVGQDVGGDLARYYLQRDRQIYS